MICGGDQARTHSNAIYGLVERGTSIVIKVVALFEIVSVVSPEIAHPGGVLPKTRGAGGYKGHIRMNSQGFMEQSGLVRTAKERVSGEMIGWAESGQRRWARCFADGAHIRQPYSL